MHIDTRSPRAVLLSLVFALLCVWPATTRAQLVPDRLYYGVGQRVVVTVDAPEDFEGELTIKLHDPRTLGVLATASAARGRTDLTGLFSTIWADKSPAVVLAQLYLDSVATGAPLVLQPLVTPNRARLVDPLTMAPSDKPSAQVVFDDDRLTT